MKDVIYTGRVSDLTALVKAIAWRDDALMMLERIPLRLTETIPCIEGLNVDRLNLSAAFEDWPIGRVYDADKELAWTQTEDGAIFHTIYSGAVVSLPKTLQPEQETAAWQQSDPQPYLLWGTSLTEHHSNTTLFPFAEAQIPRLLRYPVHCRQSHARLQVKVICYHDPATGGLQHYRFQTMEVYA